MESLKYLQRCLDMSVLVQEFFYIYKLIKYDKQDQQGKTAFIERSPEPVTRASGKEPREDPVINLLH
jgi:hypothetical protein